LIARKVAVLGLDAADFEFLDPWRAAGDLPTIDGILRGGASGPLRSTDPPVSSPAWATFMTGLNPGAHGLYDFVMEDPATLRPVLARHDLIRGRRLWDLVGAAGKRSVVVNLPITWPPPSFPGAMVTGMLTPEGRGSFTHPPELADEILRAVPGYRCDLDVALKADRAALRAHLDDLARMNAEAMRFLARREPWDLFVGIFTTTDRAQHLFWPERGTVIREHYRKVDAHLAAILGDLGPETLVILLSDHGFHGVRVKFYVNRWLQERGWLATRPRAEAAGEEAAPDRADLERGRAFFDPARKRRGLLGRIFGGGEEGEDLEVDPARSRAWLYSVWTGGIRVNLRGRSPAGTVEPGREYEDLRDAIIAGLRELRFPGEDRPLFEFVGRGEEVYRGERVGWGPDVVTRSANFSVEPGKNLERGKVIRVSRHDHGTHSETGILGIRGPGARAGGRVEGARIEDVLPTALWALGLEVPAGIDGRVLAEAFDPEVVAAHPVRVGAAGAAGPASAAGAPMTPEEEEELRRTLEGLGYL
jgi:predicted AlkP superfamily phosphohydrolase/phosphomutase